MVGPLEAADMTGLATVQDICQHLLPELAGGAQMMELVAEKVARARPARAAGKDFIAGIMPGWRVSSRVGSTSCAMP
jgi:3-hydroxybutyryl-CoA dehydrogenase